MITKISGEQPFQVLTSAFSISPSQSGYNLEISADGVNYSPLFTVGAGVTRLVTGVAANSYYRLAGNTSDVVVNWQKSCNGDGGGGGGTGSTITVDSELSSSSTNPVENRVITNALNNIPGAVVDDELSSSSTNPVENRAIYEALAGGEGPIIPLETVDYMWELSAFDSNWAGLENVLFRNTTSDRYKVINLSTEPTYAGLTGIKPYNLYVYGFDNVQTIVLEQTYQLVSPNPWNCYPDLEIPTSGGDVYLVLDVEQLTIVATRTLPSVHVDGMFQMPVAQDGSDFKKYVYQSSTDSTKGVISSVGLGGNNTDTAIRKYQSARLTYKKWGNNASQTSSYVLPTGDSYMPGVKTHRDSAIINAANEALSGLDEQITLTIGNEPSTDYLTLLYDSQPNYFYQTNDSRYVAIPTSGLTYREVGSVTLDNVVYYNLGSFRKDVILQLGEYRNDGATYFSIPGSPMPLYLIVDKAAKTIICTDSLTITRAKNIKEAFDNIPTPDMSDYWTTAETQNAIEEALYGAIITGATMPVDDHLDTGSTHPVENRVITTALSEYTTNEYVESRFDAAEAYTDSQVNNLEEQLSAAITAATQNYVTSGDVTTAITSATQNFITSGDVQTIVDAAVATAITIDDQLSTGSTNPVENRVITNALANCVQSTDVRTMVKCTLAEYNAMQSHDPNTFYIIVNS